MILRRYSETDLDYGRGVAPTGDVGDESSADRGTPSQRRSLGTLAERTDHGGMDGNATGFHGASLRAWALDGARTAIE